MGTILHSDLDAPVLVEDVCDIRYCGHNVRGNGIHEGMICKAIKAKLNSMTELSEEIIIACMDPHIESDGWFIKIEPNTCGYLWYIKAMKKRSDFWVEFTIKQHEHPTSNR